MLKSFVLAAFCALSAVPASAATILNGSFEQTSSPVGKFMKVTSGSSLLTGWTVGAGQLDVIGSYWSASNGKNSLDLNGSKSGGTISQMITDLVVGKTYTLSFDIAGNPDGSPVEKLMEVLVGAGSWEFSFDNTGTSRTAMGWLTQTVSFVASATEELLSFKSLVPTGAYGMALDNVLISEAAPQPAPVPLPAGAPLAAAAFGALALFRRRKG